MIGIGFLILEVSEISLSIIVLIMSSYLTAHRYPRYISGIVYAILGGVSSVHHLTLNIRSSRKECNDNDCLLFFTRGMFMLVIVPLGLLWYLDVSFNHTSERVLALLIPIIEFVDFFFYSLHVSLYSPGKSARSGESNRNNVEISYLNHSNNAYVPTLNERFYNAWPSQENKPSPPPYNGADMLLPAYARKPI